jgi:hypothetical protein
VKGEECANQPACGDDLRQRLFYLEFMKCLRPENGKAVSSLLPPQGWSTICITILIVVRSETHSSPLRLEIRILRAAGGRHKICTLVQKRKQTNNSGVDAPVGNDKTKNFDDDGAVTARFRPIDPLAWVPTFELINACGPSVSQRLHHGT